LAIGQSIGGVSLYSGISAFYNQDPSVNAVGDGQYGYLIGFDSRLNSGNLYFSIGGRYIVTSLVPENSMSFFSNTEDYKIGELRTGFGFNLINFNKHTRLRSKLMVSAMMAINSPMTRVEIEGYEVVNDSWGGIVTGIGLDFGPLTADLEFHKGLVNVYNEQPDSKLNAYSLTLGVFF
jgi:hypothetical protein